MLKISRRMNFAMSCCSTAFLRKVYNLLTAAKDGRGREAKPRVLRISRTTSTELNLRLPKTFVQYFQKLLTYRPSDLFRPTPPPRYGTPIVLPIILLSFVVSVDAPLSLHAKGKERPTSPHIQAERLLSVHAGPKREPTFRYPSHTSPICGEVAR